MAKPTTGKKKSDAPKLAGVRFITPPFRLSFPHIFEPHTAPGGKEAKYSITMLFPKEFENTKDAEAFAEFKKKLRMAAREAWGKDKAKWPKINWPERDGDEKAEYPGYEGHVFYSADSNNPPGIVDRDREEVVDKNVIYPGCYCRAQVTAKAVPGVGGKNYVKFYLQHVMFWDDGERLGGGGESASDAFAEYGDTGRDDEDEDTDSDDDDDDYDV